jgi:hypothetical protein
MRARLPALWAAESRLQFGGFEAENIREKGGKRRMLSEGVEEVSVVSLELLDGVMEQVEVMEKKLRRISGGIEALVKGVGRFTEAVIGLGVTTLILN